MFTNLEVLINGQYLKKFYDEESETVVKKHGLHRIESEVLFFLSNNRTKDRAKDIVENIYFSKAHVSKVIDRLVTMGYLVCMPDLKDKRCVHLKLTEKADETLHDIHLFYQRMFNVLTADIPKEDIVVFNRVAGQMALNINKELSKNIK